MSLNHISRSQSNLEKSKNRDAGVGLPPCFWGSFGQWSAFREVLNLTIPLLLASVMLASCKGNVPTPTLTQPQPVETATSPVIASTETNTALPALPTVSIHTPVPFRPSPTPILPTEVSISIPGGIVYYHFVNLAEYAPSEGSVVVLPDNLILAPTQLDTVYGSDVAADLRIALEAVLKDGRNSWLGDKLQIKQVSHSGGHADVVLEGEYYAVAPVVLTAARAQILMTLFANAAVQSATVTVNGDTIANISISHSMDAKPANYAYTRAEIETFMAENLYIQP